MVTGGGGSQVIEGAGGTQILSARVRKTIQSIKEIVGNHSELDIYAALKETDMDPNETAQKLLNQGLFFSSHNFVYLFFGFVLVIGLFVVLLILGMGVVVYMS
jgi:hypothetical protein